MMVHIFLELEYNDPIYTCKMFYPQSEFNSCNIQDINQMLTTLKEE
jgi:hypothetical protein